MLIQTKKHVINCSNIITIKSQGDSDIVFVAIGRTFTIFCIDSTERDKAILDITSEWKGRASYVDISEKEK